MQDRPIVNCVLVCMYKSVSLGTKELGIFIFEVMSNNFHLFLPNFIIWVFLDFLSIFC